MAQTIHIGLDLGSDSLKISYAYKTSGDNQSYKYGKFAPKSRTARIGIPAIAFYDRSTKSWSFGNDGSNRIMIGATNRPDKIDGAYLRYKRFSHLVHVTPPDMIAKRAIIESKLKGIELDGVGVNDVLMMSEQYTTNASGEITKYYSSADLCGIIEEACRIALEKLVEMKSNKPIPLTKVMFEQAFSKIPPSISAELLDKYAKFKDNINENFMV